MYPRKPEQLRGDVIMDQFSYFAQSQRSFENYGDIKLEIDEVYLPSGGGPIRLNKLSMRRDALIKQKKSLIHSEDFMEPNDKNCFPISTVLGIFHKLGSIIPTKRRRYEFERFKNIIRSEAQRLYDDAGINYNAMAGLFEFGIIQRKLSNFNFASDCGSIRSKKCFRLVIYELSRKVIFLGAVPDNAVDIIDIHLLLYNNHFNYIKSLAGVFAVNNFCSHCHVGYQYLRTHLNCPYTCEQCFAKPPCRLTLGGVPAEVPCMECNRVFFNETCYNIHKLRKVCEKIRFCVGCNRVKRKGHDCSSFYCSVCQRSQPYEHDCTMPAYKPRVFLGSHCYVYFDFESMLEKRDEYSGDFHVVNLCVSNVTCDQCEDSESDTLTCINCGDRKRIFFYDPDDKNSVVDSFLHYLCVLAEKFNNITVISHNGGRYDILFVAKRLFATQPNVQPSIVMRGLRIYMLKFGRLRFIDSFNFSCCALSKLPKMYELGAYCKGYFPHLFNRIENNHYTGVYPDKSMYDPGSMNSETRDDFNSWYATVEHTTFDFQREIIKYCSMDVTILRRFCTKLNTLMLIDTGIQIFRESLTIASFVSKRFRKDFFNPEISLIPLNGYRLRDNQSVIALKYISYLEKHVYNGEICSALRTGEKFVVCGSNRYKVDGYLERETAHGMEKIVIEFFGCHYHGHGCQNNFLTTAGTDRWARDRLMQIINRETAEKRVVDLRGWGYKVVVMWECEFREFLRINPHIEREVEWVSKNKLEPRDSFFGGRTECFTTYYKCKPNEQIRYYDVCSLYPYVNKYGKNVVKAPKVIIGDECKTIDLSIVDGLIKLRVYPPDRLYHPILPLRMNNKLLFPLCFTCASESNNDDCVHDDSQRSWVGTYVADELRVAITHGYRVGEIYEAWVYQTVNGLFAEYIKYYQKEKLYASGMPSGYNEDTIDEFVHEYEVREGVTLDKSKFQNNPAKRNFAKIMNNSLWGRMGMNIRTSTRILTDAAEFNKMMTDASIVIRAFKIMNEKTLLVSYDNHNAQSNNTSNVVIASFTTAIARIELNTMLQKCGKRCLYADTDCCFYVENINNEPLLKTGSFLGDLTNELETYGKHSYIDTFVSCGPKSYSYKVVNTDSGDDVTVVKVKGITLNSCNKEIINFETMCAQIINSQDAPSLSVTSTIFVKENDLSIHSMTRKKDFRVVVNKRRRVGFQTFPYGYKLTDMERIDAWKDYRETVNTPLVPSQMTTTVVHETDEYDEALFSETFD